MNLNNIFFSSFCDTLDKIAEIDRPFKVIRKGVGIEAKGRDDKGKDDNTIKPRWEAMQSAPGNQTNGALDVHGETVGTVSPD